MSTWKRTGRSGRSRPGRARWALVLALALVATACGNGDDGDTAADEPEAAADDTEESDDAGDDEADEQEEAAAELDCGRIDFVVPVAAGGGSDLYTRTIFQGEASKYLDTTVAVRNVPGDGQMLGVGEVFRADADGCTLTTYNPPSITIAQLARGDEAPVDIREAEYVGGWGSASLTLFGHVDSPGDTFEEVVDLYESGELTTYGAQDRAGPTELLGHILKDNYGMAWEELVAYDGGGDLAAAVLRQEVPYGVTTDTSIQDQVAAGQFKVIAVLTDEPSTILEGEPTLIEQGFDSLDYIAAFTRLVATVPGTPEPQRQALEDALRQAIESEEIQTWAEESGNPVTFIEGARAAEIVDNSFSIEDEVPNLEEILAGE
jgi:tripartite-type tricarboxylate transporter receptor subunit TctC